MAIRSFLLFFLTLSLTACVPDGKYPKAELAEQTAAWAKMMEGHDVVMPLMDDLYQASTALKPLAESAMVEASDFHPRAQLALQNIETAEDAMMEWMNHIRENPLDSLREKSADHAAVMAFIADGQQQIDDVAAAMQQSLAAAKLLIQERTGN